MIFEDLLRLGCMDDFLSYIRHDTLDEICAQTCDLFFDPPKYRQGSAQTQHETYEEDDKCLHDYRGDKRRLSSRSTEGRSGAPKRHDPTTALVAPAATQRGSVMRLTPPSTIIGSSGL